MCYLKKQVQNEEKQLTLPDLLTHVCTNYEPLSQPNVYVLYVMAE